MIRLNRFTRALQIACGLYIAGFLGGHAPAQQNDLMFDVHLRDGSLIGVQAENQTLDWKTVAADGATSLRKVSLAEIERLKLAISPASKQVAEIRQLVAQLASPRYLDRHAAEAKLVNDGAPFIVVISQASDHQEPEVRYRIERILNELKERKLTTRRRSVEFDDLRLSDGTELEGDVVDWGFECSWGTSQLTLKRDRVVTITRRSREGTAEAHPPEQIAVKAIVSDEAFFDENDDVRAGSTFVTFDKGPEQEALVWDTNFPIDRFFSYLGCLLDCEKNDGHVVISQYRFKYGRSGNCAIGNVFRNDKNREVLYQGTMRISFCDPNRPGVPATVNRVGMNLEIVLPRHTVVEAYNSADHLLGAVLSDQEIGTSFLGFESNFPIAYVRIRANTELETDEPLNEDFALDDLCFSQPIVARDINRSDHHVVVLDDGQRILGGGVELSGADVGKEELRLLNTTVTGQDKSIPITQVDWYLGPLKPAVSHDDGVFVMLSDGSVVHCQSQGGLSLSVQSRISIDPSEVIGLWGAETQVRYPNVDLQQGNHAIVWTNRSVAVENMAIDTQTESVAIKLEGAKTIRQGVSDDSGAPITNKVTDTTSDEVQTRYALSQAPSLWWRSPVYRAPNTGVLRTYDGQQFVLGGESGFALSGLGTGSVTISRGGENFSITLDKVRALEFP